jgi:von Willebrand factor type A domain
MLFDQDVYDSIPLQVVSCGDIARIRQSLSNLRFYGGGTSMYSALAHTFKSLLHGNATYDSWVICLTDGVSDCKDYNLFRELLMQSQVNQHLVTVGIALPAQYEQAILDMCQKFASTSSSIPTKGFFVRAESTTSGMDDAFNIVKSKIPVSQTFDRDGKMSDEECRLYMAKYLPDFVNDDDMVSKSFWIRFLYRRVTAFDNNESFNYNETYENLGSSLMRIMLIEVERLLSENQQRDWQAENYMQLIYDFNLPEKPEFRLVCTSPDDIDPALKKKLTTFDLPGFHIPSKQELDNRTSLDMFLSTALGVPRHTGKDGLLKIKCIDDYGFVLTIDFTMKLLSIHERVACQVPCVIEGETGVSKTALTKMYAILRNHSMTYMAQQKTAESLEEIENVVKDEGFTLPDGLTTFNRLDRAMDLDVRLAKRILDLTREMASGRSSVFVDLPPLEGVDELAHGRQRLEFFSNAVLEKTFFEINVDASFTEGDFIKIFKEVTAVAKKIVNSEATVVVFLDGKFTFGISFFWATSNLFVSRPKLSRNKYIIGTRVAKRGYR